MIGSLVFKIVLNVVIVRFIDLGSFDTWLRHVLCYDCLWSPFSHVFEHLDHSSKISDDFPNIIS